jgi:leucine dehydrogenase
MGIAASVRHRLGRAELHGIRVAVQGLGNVGWNLCHLLTEAGASLIVSDIRSNLVEQARQTFGAACVPPEHICSVEADVFAPCALGAVINDTSVSLLQVSVVAGGANNQLANEERHADALMARGILYAPDYVINAGGMIQLAVERTGLDWAVVERRVRQIGDTLSEIFLRAQAEKLPTAIVAAALARERIARASHGIMP